MRAAKEGGAVMARKVGAAVIKTKANARDLLTEVDGEVQRIIEARVAEAFPQHGFLVRKTTECFRSKSLTSSRRAKRASQLAKMRALMRSRRYCRQVRDARRLDKLN